MAETFLIAGLGNPGRQYRENRHNVGFMLLDRLAVKLDARFTRLQSRALVASGNYEGSKVILAKPQTFMNLSGQSVQGLMRFYKLPIEKLLVVHDHLDLPPGTIRIRPDGGAGGQRGMESILERLGRDDFARLRIGIGRPPGRMDPADYVLQNFSQADMTILSETLNWAAEAVLAWIKDGLEAAMNRFNGVVE
ncbi:MAG: aminoacyl-tRNA hydrolase [Anaerolineales bacterium]|nr:aminoacyl-tRNA hydrolase [Anaerolineales bacterium]